MNKTYEEWLKYYENATKEQVIGDMMLDINNIKEKDKEIERLNNILNSKFADICKKEMIDKLSAVEMIIVQDKEIKRLNNIIDELEKHLIAMSKIYEEEYKDIDTSEHYKSMLNKLKELKGIDKDENNK